MIGECLCPERVDCSLAERGRKRRSNEHHLYYPANQYATPLEKAFRELAMNRIQLCICEHDQLHSEMLPPKKPPVAEMLVALTVQFGDQNGENTGI